jgi:hypothetical protein
MTLDNNRFVVGIFAISLYLAFLNENGLSLHRDIIDLDNATAYDFASCESRKPFFRIPTFRIPCSF